MYDLRAETLQPRLAGKVPAPANAEVPGQFALSQNYPNPFNPATNIEFQLPQASHITLKIYDLQGWLVKTLLNQEMEAGSHRVAWNGRDERGNAAASGVYLYHFQAGEFSRSRLPGAYRQTGKMVLLR
ncbi:MAG: T9SS type A sorting domain-containing protein [Calditrichaceae bacterium]|nr:T9SS type A sorting domain-containing protein [Calditrichia bacterium]NUQ41506.1 T9SS type A sorting domain-containing protein [Calditrichaceae bacterium]